MIVPARSFTRLHGLGNLLILAMYSIAKLIEVRDRIRKEGIAWFASRSSKVVKDWIFPPWSCMYWFPLSESPNGERRLGLPLRSVNVNGQSVELRVIRNLEELDFEEYQSLTESIGVSDLPVCKDRLAKGIELHMLRVGNRVVGTLYLVFGKVSSFQHVILTDRDVMGLDGRIVPEFRGNGLYPMLLSRSIEKLRQQGFERLFIDANENNVAATRSYESVGFRLLLRYKLWRGIYWFDKKAV